MRPAHGGVPQTLVPVFAQALGFLVASQEAGGLGGQLEVGLSPGVDSRADSTDEKTSWEGARPVTVVQRGLEPFLAVLGRSGLGCSSPTGLHTTL